MTEKTKCNCVDGKHWSCGDSQCECECVVGDSIHQNQHECKKASEKKLRPIMVNFVLDETGSMQSVKKETINGFNEYVSTLKKQEVPTRLTLVKFNSAKTQVSYVGMEIQNVPDLNEDTYVPDQMTPLYDAIGKSIVEVEKKLAVFKTQKKAAPRVVFAILTDGEENSSREYTREQIFKMVKDREERGWTFVFMGADQNAYANSSVLGFSAANTLSYTSADTAKVYRSFAMNTANLANSSVSNTTNFWKTDATASNYPVDDKTVQKKNKIVSLLNKVKKAKK